MIIAVSRDKHQNRSAERLRVESGEMAQKVEKFATTVLRSSIAFLRANSSAGVTSAMVGATIESGRRG